MQIQAFLCDAQHVRNGLLYILGGGITRLFRHSYPGPLGIDLAIMLHLHPTEAGEAHRLKVITQNADGLKLHEINAEFQATEKEKPAGLLPGEMVPLPLGISLKHLAVPKEGPYSIELLIDGQHKMSLPFSCILLAPEGSGQER